VGSLKTFGRSGGSDKFQRMHDATEEIDEEDDLGVHHGRRPRHRERDSVVMETFRTRTETECKADNRSESGSETALSPSSDINKGPSDIGVGRTLSLKGITVSRSIVQISESERR
jgi:hypothetical protein